jgi:hypothetical protein
MRRRDVGDRRRERGRPRQSRTGSSARALLAGGLGLDRRTAGTSRPTLVGEPGRALAAASDSTPRRDGGRLKVGAQWDRTGASVPPVRKRRHRGRPPRLIRRTGRETQAILEWIEAFYDQQRTALDHRHARPASPGSPPRRPKKPRSDAVGRARSLQLWEARPRSSSRSSNVRIDACAARNAHRV